MVCAGSPGRDAGGTTLVDFKILSKNFLITL